MAHELHNLTGKSNGLRVLTECLCLSIHIYTCICILSIYIYIYTYVERYVCINIYMHKYTHLYI